MSGYKVLGFYLRVDIDPRGEALVSLFDMDDKNEEMPIAEATGATADAAVTELFSKITLDVEDEGDV